MTNDSDDDTSVELRLRLDIGFAHLRTKMPDIETHRANMRRLRDARAGRQPPAERRRPRVVAMAIAAVVPLAIIGGVLWQWGAGSADVVRFEDGSTLIPQRGARVTERMTVGAREVDLANGGGSFRVVPDASRPFRVKAPAVVITVVGTEFDVVYVPPRAPDSKPQTTVSVKEGRVKLEQDGTSYPAIVLDPGEKAVVTGEGKDGRVMLRVRSTLPKAVDAFNGRSSRMRFVVQGSACNRRLEAMLSLDTPDSLILALENDGELELVRLPADASHPARVLIRERSDTAIRASDAESTCASVVASARP